ncbi:TetR family transcriptional regulator [Rhodococcus sp. BP-149]|uniref:TetR family transcriptional regulator n=1 Tax=unclassified Rhodococcus (in: high G+C Gram-positive bacteria) TaxID=192944 RepID=UPI001C9B6921|nr:MULTISPECIES: TetR family transcriptional regulator [unclassified Rhodococcus (in: high G+C Gram-positive bacteria)]MBY6681367.1 TetR family transcriptional regulator [Rhodococcus sp. BP-316]MBY6686273.1 TetR family transcriptional regulator [Rhodococcus sp. BP-288]MBY6693638.1 TetR family transcriptional regulator [Rhodococcus sp. BP-188]MBY6699765.1 TetR family transcriptional regulator [Rhodococcus sp. BP-285]MBY6703890.1 TetR family transcriptional regulator [Rhodococcus sp. BP-283]
MSENSVGSTTASRAERKERTRRALVDGTLDAIADRSFSSVSLREVTRAAGIVPTAFYRHFASMEDLGVAVVEDSMRVLRKILRDVRRHPSADNARESLELLVGEIREHDVQFRFLIRERSGGVVEVRRAIETELRMIVHELTQDLSRISALSSWPGDDLEMVADLIVNTMLATVVDLVEVTPAGAAERDIVERALSQLRVIMLGMGQWQPRNVRGARTSAAALGA